LEEGKRKLGKNFPGNKKGKGVCLENRKAFVSKERGEK